MNPADLRRERSQRWRPSGGFVPGCARGTMLILSTDGQALDLTLPRHCLVARLNRRAATAGTSGLAG